MLDQARARVLGILILTCGLLVAGNVAVRWL